MKACAVLLAGFGGPETADEVRPFLESVLSGTTVPRSRLEAVAAHYDEVGGASPFNAHTRRQRQALEEALVQAGKPVPVFAAYRHSSPSFEDFFKQAGSEGLRHVVVIVLASLRSGVSYEKYVDRLEAARKKMGAEPIELVYTPRFHAHPFFIDCQAARIRQAHTAAGTPSDDAFYFFTAHSIPTRLSDESGYSSQLNECASLVARQLGLRHWALAYQSRSGRPEEAWLEPDVKDAIRGVDRSKFNRVVLVPAGFLCDNVEVLYDLDRDARSAAEEAGLAYHRAPTAMDDPHFITLLKDLVLRQMEFSA